MFAPRIINWGVRRLQPRIWLKQCSRGCVFGAWLALQGRVLYERKLFGSGRNLLAVHRKNEDLINIGAYVKGSDPNCDKAIAMMNDINAFLIQSTKDKIEYDTTINSLLQLGQTAGAG